MKNDKIGFIGGGRITRIILHAYRNRSVIFDSVRVFEPDPTVSARLKEEFSEIEITPSEIEPALQDILFLAVHPPVLTGILESIKDAVSPGTTVISLAPKITMAKMAGILNTGRIARLIPNATSYINRGYNPVSFMESFPPEEKEVLVRLLKKLGKTIEVEEEKLEAYAIISAMLPTYFWFQWKKMEEIALKTGLQEDESRKIIRSTLLRSLKLYYNSGLSPEQVIDLIPVKPIGENEEEIESILESKLTGLYQKIRP